MDFFFGYKLITMLLKYKSHLSFFVVNIYSVNIYDFLSFFVLESGKKTLLLVIKSVTLKQTSFKSISFGMQLKRGINIIIFAHKQIICSQIELVKIQYLWQILNKIYCRLKRLPKTRLSCLVFLCVFWRGIYSWCHFVFCIL